MKITCTSKQGNLPSDFLAAAEKKLGKFDRFFDDATATVKTGSKKGVETVELTISSSGTLYRSEKKSDTLQNALDEAVDAILRQIRKNKTRLENRLKKGAFQPVTVDEPVESEEPEFVVHSKKFPIKPMEVGDAILQMLLLEHDFFLFINPHSGELNVVYRRKDGEYGVIIPE